MTLIKSFLKNALVLHNSFLITPASFWLRSKDEVKAASGTSESKEEMGAFLQSVQPGITLAKDVILNESTRLQLEEALIKIKHHDTIYTDWDFQRVDKAGRGVVVNFYGPPGTGKTRSAEAFAGELGLQFYGSPIGRVRKPVYGANPA